jgi:hypothetical protein
MRSKKLFLAQVLTEKMILKMRITTKKKNSKNKKDLIQRMSLIGRRFKRKLTIQSRSKTLPTNLLNRKSTKVFTTCMISQTDEKVKTT